MLLGESKKPLSDRQKDCLLKMKFGKMYNTYYFYEGESGKGYRGLVVSLKALASRGLIRVFKRKIREDSFIYDEEFSTITFKINEVKSEELKEKYCSVDYLTLTKKGKRQLDMYNKRIS